MNFLHYLIAALLITMLLAAITFGDNQKSESSKTVDLSTGRTLYTVGYAHLDTQWLWDYPLVLKEYIPNTMHDNFRLIDKYPNYIFNFSGANRYRMMKEYYPKDYERVKRYVAAGRWFPCGSSMEECDVMATSAESIIRHVLYGNDYFRKEFGKDSVEFILPDCFGFPASLPSLLGHCGLKGFSSQKLTWGSAVGIPFNVGVWEGLDGTSIITALNPGAYVDQIKEDLSHSEAWLKRIDQNGKKSGVFADYHYFGAPGDIGGAPEEDSVKWIEKCVASDGPVRVISSTAEQMFLDIKPEQAAKLPRYKGDLLLTEHSAGSITSQAYVKRLNRMNELLASSAERASIAAEWFGGLDYPQKKLNDAWTLVMGGQFHDILPGTSLPKCYEYSWNDEILALNQFSSILEISVGSIASGLDTRAKGKALVVYNPLSIEREDVVEATVIFSNAVKTVKVVGPDGKQTPSQILSSDNGSVKLLFIAKVPSVGFTVYDIQPVESSPTYATGLYVTDSSLESPRYRVKVDAKGDVSSIYDKLAKREMLSSPIRLAFTYDNPSYWPAWNIDWNDQKNPPRSYVEGPAKVRIVENGPVRVALEIEREAEGSKFVQTVRLSAGSAGDRVEFSNLIDWRSRECNLKAVFPLSVSNPEATYNWEVGTVKRGNNDPKKYEVPSHQWFDLTDTKGDYGVMVLSPFKYGSDKPNDNTLRLTLLRTPGVRGGFKDQSTQDWGRHDITFGLVGHVNDWRERQTNWQAMSIEQPLVAFQCSSHSGELGKTLSLVKLDDPRVQVMALKKAENSDETIIRIVETTGNPVKDLRIAFAAPIISAKEVNGQEQPIGDVKIVDSQLATDLTPYRLRTFAVKLAKPPVSLKSPRSQAIDIAYDCSTSSCDGDKSIGGFDSEGRCLAAEMLPSQVIDGGIIFKLGPTGNGKKNALACKGQMISLPKGKFNRIALLVASSTEDQPAVFEVDGKKVELTIQSWGGFIGQWDNRIWKDNPEEEWPYGYNGLVPGYIKRAPVAWFCSHRHNADGENELYVYSYLYTHTIDVPNGSKTLKLPDNPNIRVMAVSVVLDPTIDCRPSQPLYDTLEDHKAMPRM